MASTPDSLSSESFETSDSCSNSSSDFFFCGENIGMYLWCKRFLISIQIINTYLDRPWRLNSFALMTIFGWSFFPFFFNSLSDERYELSLPESVSALVSGATCFFSLIGSPFVAFPFTGTWRIWQVVHLMQRNKKEDVNTYIFFLPITLRNFLAGRRCLGILLYWGFFRERFLCPRLLFLQAS